MKDFSSFYFIVSKDSNDETVRDNLKEKSTNYLKTNELKQLDRLCHPKIS